jgi:hypothetical protein
LTHEETRDALWIRRGFSVVDGLERVRQSAPHVSNTTTQPFSNPAESNTSKSNTNTTATANTAKSTANTAESDTTISDTAESDASTTEPVGVEQRWFVQAD